VFSHPVYQYFIRRYGLNGLEVHWEPEEAPTPEQWQELGRLLARHPARWMVWEGTPDPATVAELEKRGLDSVVFDPCGNVPEEGDYLSVMRENVRRFSEVGAEES
jgi:zinc transport system substrate-binding protein